jgi:hypothetical protein
MGTGRSYPFFKEESWKFWKAALTGPFRKFYEETDLPYYVENLSEVAR